MNRILVAIANAEAKIKARRLEPARLRELTGTLDMDFEEWTCCQERKSLAVASGAMNVNEGMLVYSILGSGPADFNTKSLAQKVVITQLLKELLQSAVA